MARVELSDVLLRNGAPVGNALVTVKVVSGAAGSTTLYTSETGVATIPELRTQENGEFVCWVEEGRYSVTAGGMTKTVEAVNQASVEAGSVGNESITTAKLKNEAVTEAKIANKAVGEAKVSAGLLTKIEEKGTVAAEGITTEKLAALAVTEAKIAANAVTEGKIKDKAITKAKLTTAFQEEIEGKAVGLIAVNEQTAAYTLKLADNERCVDVNKASATIITVPKNAVEAFKVGSLIELSQIGAGQIELKAEEAGTPKLRSPESLLKSRVQYSTIALRKRATDEWVVSGDLA